MQTNQISQKQKMTLKTITLHLKLHPGVRFLILYLDCNVFCSKTEKMHNYPLQNINVMQKGFFLQEIILLEMINFMQSVAAFLIDQSNGG